MALVRLINQITRCQRNGPVHDGIGRINYVIMLTQQFGFPPLAFLKHFFYA